jgi:hypothetical protein
MAIKYYRLYCDICDHSIVTDGTNIKLVEYKRSKIQKEIPKLDATTGKMVPATWLILPKKYKCPKCGRLISPRKCKELEPIEDKTKSNPDENINPRSQGGFERL